MTRSSHTSSLVLALLVSMAAAAAAQAQPPQPSPTPGQITEQQIQQASQQLTQQNPGAKGMLPTPQDIANGMAKMGFGQQTTLANNPNATNLNNVTVPQAASTDFGAAAVGVGQPLVNHSQQVGAIIDEMTNQPGSQSYQAQQAQIRANQHDGPGYYTTDLATGQSTWHDMPPNLNYSQMDAYVQARLANPQNQQQVRDPFAQPDTTTTTQPTPPPPAPAPAPYIPQLPTGPGYPTYHPTAKPTSSQTSDSAAIGAAIGAAMGEAVAAAEAAAASNGDQAAAEAEAAAVNAIASQVAGAVIGQATVDSGQSLDQGCASGACGAYLAHPYNTAQWQPMPMFTEGNGDITNNGVAMTQVAQLLPIYQGYDPFATGNLVPWPGQMIVPTLYPPTGVSSAGIMFDPNLNGLSGYSWLAAMQTGPSAALLGLQPILCGR